MVRSLALASSGSLNTVAAPMRSLFLTERMAKIGNYSETDEVQNALR
jgi:hypothetical protein